MRGLIEWLGKRFSRGSIRYVMFASFTVWWPSSSPA